VHRFLVGLLAVLAVGSAGMGRADAFAPNVHVTPRTGVTDGEFLFVNGSGWARSSEIGVRECSGGVWSGDQNACGPFEITDTFSSKGRRKFVARIAAETGAVGDGFCGLGVHTQTQRSCAIEAVQLDKNEQPTSTVALRRIVFAS
jgi:hypothetical protein